MGLNVQNWKLHIITSHILVPAEIVIRSPLSYIKYQYAVTFILCIYEDLFMYLHRGTEEEYLKKTTCLNTQPQ